MINILPIFLTGFICFSFLLLPVFALLLPDLSSRFFLSREEKKNREMNQRRGNGHCTT